MKTEKIVAYFDGNRTHARWEDGKGFRYHVWLNDKHEPIKDGSGEIIVFKNKIGNDDYRYRTKYLKGSVPANAMALDAVMAHIKENDLISIAYLAHIEREKAQVEAHRRVRIAQLRGEAHALGFDIVARE